MFEYVHKCANSDPESLFRQAAMLAILETAAYHYRDALYAVLKA